MSHFALHLILLLFWDYFKDIKANLFVMFLSYGKYNANFPFITEAFRRRLEFVDMCRAPYGKRAAIFAL